jgi:benzylsuccinate CoA-transferase BbsE subunit
VVGPIDDRSEPVLLDGIRVVEIASDRAAYAGKLLGDLGADVIVVEPPGGHRSRTYGPFVDDEPDPERCLWWWNYNTSKRGVVLDLHSEAGATAFRSLVADADIVLEAEDPGSLDTLGLDHAHLRAEKPELIWVSVTPYGRLLQDCDTPATDLTLLAGGGMVWNCGYDDHTIAPVRPSGNHAMHTASAFAVLGALTALVSRDVTGVGQHVDVSMHAALNVTTEVSTTDWLFERSLLKRQTGRHASAVPTMEIQVQAGDGRYVTTGIGLTSRRDFQAGLDWLRDLGLEHDFPEAFFLQMGVDRGGVDLRSVGTDAEATAIYGAGRAVLTLIASRLTADEFFVQAQERGFICGVVSSPEEALFNPHFVARGYPVEVEHPDVDRTLTYPGLPFKGAHVPERIRRAPLVGEHTAEVLGRVPADPGRTR